MTTAFPSGRELALIATALLLPIPLLAASGVMVPLPSAVERALVSLLPAGEVETAPGGGLPVSTSPRSSPAPAERASNGPGSEQSSAGALSEGGTSKAPAGNGAAGSDDSAADNVLPGDERLLPGGREADLPAAPDTPAPEAGPQPPSADPPRADTGTPPVSVSQNRVEVDTETVVGAVGVSADVSQQNGITLTADVGENDTSGDVTVTVPLPTIPLP